jgi:hypothetical protein
MPTTARRLAVLTVIAVAGALAAETPADQIDFLATALQRGDTQTALSLFDPRIADFAGIRRGIEALALLPNTSCDIEIERTTKQGDAFQLETQWKLALNSRDNGPLVTRTEHVSISLRQTDGAWKIVAFTPVRILAGRDDTVFTRIAAFAGNLSENDGPEALAFFDSAMSQYGEISNDIDALVNQSDVLCAIDAIDDNQSGGIHKLDTDWFLQLKSRADLGPTERRRERVQLQMELIKGKWKITGITPLDILAPIQVN